MFFKKQKYLIIFGGRSDEKVTVDGRTGFRSLNEILIYDILQKEWRCVAQHGFAPSARWGAALAVSEFKE